ncbi:MAG: restriction endonuclease subunit S, partial [Bacteroidota bacterium]|nr:restriction endonuclease subunit S [Bacteroidota bacterium]
MRFPEFQGSIQRNRLNDITTWASGGTPSKANESFWNGSIPWISASSMKDIWLAKSEFAITEEGLKHGSKLAPKGAILILVRGSMLVF